MEDDRSPGSPRLPPTGADGPTHRFSYDRSDGQSIGVAITQAVASVSGADPLSLEPRLYDVLDPDALKTLLTSGTADSDVRISFSFGRCAVAVTGTGEILVRAETPPS